MIRVLLLFAALAAPAAFAADRINGAEGALARTLQAIEQNRRSDALAEIDRLIAERPNFRLAHLIRGDLLLARVRPIEALGNTGHAARERLEELRAEASLRLRALREPPPAALVPRNLVQLAPGVKHLFAVDAGRSRVYVLENTAAGARVVADFYATLGKQGIEKVREGDQKTPLGVYFVTSRIPGAKLPDLYGWGAFPINYPNEWDRLAGKTGYGIWLHGVPSDTYARAPRVSDGCVALANPDIEAMGAWVEPGATPVLIAEAIEWVSPQALRAERDDFLKSLEAWRADWESRDPNRYLAHYAKGFRSGKMDLEAWSAHKRKVNASKKWIKVALSGASVLRYPGRAALMVATFDQSYRSDRFSQQTRKRQYWVRESGRWKIGYEGPVKGGAIALPESYARASRAAR
jgi:murein L,D-transpeptidase YafK